MSSPKPDSPAEPLLPHWAAFGGYVGLVLAVAKAVGELAPLAAGGASEEVIKAVISPGLVGLLCLAHVIGGKWNVFAAHSRPLGTGMRVVMCFAASVFVLSAVFGAMKELAKEKDSKLQVQLEALTLGQCPDGGRLVRVDFVLPPTVDRLNLRLCPGDISDSIGGFAQNGGVIDELGAPLDDSACRLVDLESSTRTWSGTVCVQLGAGRAFGRQLLDITARFDGAKVPVHLAQGGGS